MRDSNTRVNKQPNKNICLHVNLFTCLHSLWRHAAFPDIAFKKNKIYHKLSISFPFNRRTKAFDWSWSNESNRRTHPFNDISARVCINAQTWSMLALAPLVGPNNTIQHEPLFEVVAPSLQFVTEMGTSKKKEMFPFFHAFKDK